MQTLGLSDSTPKSEGRLRALLWPRIHSDISASTAAQNAMYAGFAVGALTTVFVLLRMTPVSSLLDAALFVMLGIGVRQFSITASILAFLLYATNVVTFTIHGVLGPGIVVAVIITSLFVSAIRAALFMRSYPGGIEATAWTRIWRWTRPVVFTLFGALLLLFIAACLLFLIPTGALSRR
jgi:hypothetical protein